MHFEARREAPGSSNPNETAGSTSSQPPKVPRGNRNVAIAIAVIVVVAAFTGAYFLGLFGHASSRPWLFKGAYATYSGETAYLTIVFNFTIKVQILDLNSTAVETLSYYSLNSSIFSSANQTTHWSQLTSNVYSIQTPSGYNLSRTYDATRLVVGNAVACTAYEFKQGNTTLTEYASKSIGFPIEFAYSSALPSGGVLSLDLALVRTNIPGL